MQISLEALEQALSPIESIGRGETTVEVGPINLTLRILFPEEEAEVQKYAQEKGDPESGGHAMEFVERFKVALLSFAIIEVDGQNLRDVDAIETGEVLPNGVAVKVPKAQALRKLVSRWSNLVRMRVFHKYTELLSKVETEAEAAIKFEPSDIDAEIERLERRLDQLRGMKEQERTAVETEVNRIVKTLGDKNPQTPKTETPHEEPTPEPVPEPVKAAPAPPPPQPTAAPAVRRSSIPGVDRPGVPPPKPQATPVPVPATQSSPEQYAAGMDVPDSFVNVDDQDSLEAAVQAENRRLMQARRAAATGQAPEEVPSVLTAVRRRPPHMDAAETADSLETQYLGRTADGIDTFRMSPPEEMTMPRKGAPMDKKSSQATNPRFQPPRKP